MCLGGQQNPFEIHACLMTGSSDGASERETALPATSRIVRPTECRFMPSVFNYRIGVCVVAYSV